MISNNSTNFINKVYGQVEEPNLSLNQNLNMNLGDKYIVIRNQQDQESLRFFEDGGLIKFQVKDGDNWTQSQTMTDPGVVTENDSAVLPHIGGLNRISLESGSFQLFLQNVLRQSNDGQTLYTKCRNVEYDNEIYDLLMKVNLDGTKKFQIVNSSNQQVVFELSNDNIDAKNKPILNVLQSGYLTSAVNLQQLQDMKPSYLQTGGPSNNIQIQNSIEATLISINNARFRSDIPLEYNLRPVTFFDQTIPDTLKVTQMLANYQLLSEKNAADGYLGLNSSTKIDNQYMPLSGSQLMSGILKTYSLQNITTDNILEGLTNLYHTSQRVNDIIDTQKGISSGICPLDGNQKIPSQYIDAIPTGNIYSGIDSEKTNPANPDYVLQTPVQGDQYISTDTSNIYILKGIPFTNVGNWVQLVFPGVNSVNGNTGTVSLTTDDIPQGVVNKYFDGGIANYLTSSANTPNNLLKLDASGYIQSNQLSSQLRLKNGSIDILDNEINQMLFRNSINLDPLFNVNIAFLTAYKLLKYNSLISIVNNTDIVHKQYVDSSIQAHYPIKIQNANTSVQLTTDQANVIIDGLQVCQIKQSDITSNIPVKLNTLVPIIEEEQLVTKLYVDTILNDFVNGSGIEKEFVDIKSTQSITSSQKITGWILQLQGNTQERIQFNVTDTVSILAGQYRIYIDIQIQEVTEIGLVEVTVQLRNSSTLQVYQEYIHKISSQGGDQIFSISHPFTHQFDSDATLELYVIVPNNVYGIYKSEFFIEELQKVGVTVGRDRITNPTLVSKLQITDQELDIKVNSVDYGKFTQNKLQLNDGIKIKYDPNTTNTDAYQLVTKAYVDQEVDLATATITNLGQLMHVQLTIDQTSGLQVSNTVLLNFILSNTSLTTTVDSLGVFTFQPGFIYRVFYTLSCRFLSNVGFAQFVCKNATSQLPIPGSYLYILMAANSNDTQVGSTMFYIDTRSEISPVTFKFAILAQQNLAQIYKQFSGCCIEQVQQIQELLFDRIQNVDISSRLRLYNQQLEIKLNSQIVQNIENSSGNVIINQQIDDTYYDLKSTINSEQIQQKVSLSNTSLLVNRQSEFLLDINSEFQSIIRARITDNIGGNKKIVDIGGQNGDQLNLYTSDYLNPQLTMYTDTMTNPLPILLNQKIGYAAPVTITENRQLVTKQFTEDFVNNNYKDRIQNSDITSRLYINGQQLETKLNNQLVQITQNSSGNVLVDQQINNTYQTLRSTATSNQIQQKVQLQNTSLLVNRQSEIQLDVNNECQSVVRARITNNLDGNKKMIDVGGQNGDQLNLYSTDYLNPQIQVFTNTIANPLPILLNQKIGYAAPVTITENRQLVTKQHVESYVTTAINNALANAIPVGSIFVWYSNVIPTGYLLCDGTAYNTLTYPQLFTVLGTANVPNFKGYFLRGLESSASPLVETDTFRALKSVQGDLLRSHNHPYSFSFPTSTTATELIYAPLDQNRTYVTSVSSSNVDSNTSSSGGVENRPKNIAVNYIIKAL